jgi:endonuclease III-like uncharacterized protein
MSDTERNKRLVQCLRWMINSGDEAESMSNKELAEVLCECPGVGQEHVSSLESAVIGEVLERLQHPYTWRLRRRWSKINARFQAWRYWRNKR